MSSWIYFAGDIVVTLCIFVIAWKSEHRFKWLAFVPIANLWLMCDMADAPVWYVLLFFIPLAGLVVWVYLWMNIAEYTNKPSWLGYLMAIPILNVGVAAYMAFYDPA